MVIDEVDKKIWEMLKDSMPRVSKFVAVVCAILNLLLPGFGTTVAACAAEDALVSKSQLVCALLQLLTAPYLLFGYVWSIYWSYMICMKAWNPS